MTYKNMIGLETSRGRDFRSSFRRHVSWLCLTAQRCAVLRRASAFGIINNQLSS